MNRTLNLVLAILLAVIAAPLRADLIVNGSFETPNVPTGQFLSYVAGSTSIPGWSVVGTDVVIIDNIVAVGVLFQAQDGQQMIDFTGVLPNSQNTGVVQSVATTVGTDYLLSFYVGSAMVPNFFFPSTIDLSIDGGPRVSYHNPTAPNNMVDWLQFSVPFTAQNSVTTIAFLNGCELNNFECLLDNVVLVIDAELLLGDVNGDGSINLLDVSPFVDSITSGCYIENADMNQDGEVSRLDINLFIAALLG